MRLLRVLSLSLQAKHGPRLAACVDGERGGVQLMPTKIGLNSLCNLEQCLPKTLKNRSLQIVFPHQLVHRLTDVLHLLPLRKIHLQGHVPSEYRVS